MSPDSLSRKGDWLLIACGARGSSPRRDRRLRRSARSADALDNALAESVIGLFKTELIRRRGPWRTVEHVEAATLAWIDWFNQHRLLETNGDLPPIELEHAHYRQTTDLTEAG